MSSSPTNIVANDRQTHKLGKSSKVYREIHPSTAPTWRREDFVASTADTFSHGESVVSQIENRDVPDTKVRRKGKPVVDAAIANAIADRVSPKTHRDQKIITENEKFAHHDGIVQLIGEKDRASPPRPEGKSKNVQRDVHPEVAPRMAPDDARAIESEKFAKHLTDST